jgi:hypothetical protein
LLAFSNAIQASTTNINEGPKFKFRKCKLASTIHEGALSARLDKPAAADGAGNMADETGRDGCDAARAAVLASNSEAKGEQAPGARRKAAEEAPSKVLLTLVGARLSLLILGEVLSSDGFPDPEDEFLVCGKGASIFEMGTPLLGEVAPLFGEVAPLFGERAPLFGERAPLFGKRAPLFSVGAPLFAEGATVDGG